MRPTLALLSTLVLSTGAATAQNCKFVPDSTTGGGNNVIPFGHQSPTNTTWSNQKYQTLVPTSVLGNAAGLICELAFVPTTSGIRQFSSITVTLAQTTATTLSTTFATNLATNATKVLDARDYYWPNTALQWERLGFQKSYLYIPARGNLVIDIEVRGAGMPQSNPSHAGMRSVSQVRLFAYGWTTNPPVTGSLSSSSGLRMEICFDTNDARAFGLGCASSTNNNVALSYTGSAQLGNTLGINLSGALGPRPAVLFTGLSNQAPFPIELTAIGAPGCSLYISPDFPLGLATNASGGGSVSIPIPNVASLVCLRLYHQFLCLDQPANALGLTFSNYGRALLGN